MISKANHRSFLTITISLFIIFTVSLFVTPNVKADINIGDILVVEDGSDVNPDGVVFIINPNTGQRTILTDFGNPAQGPGDDEPRDLTMEPNGDICVLNSDGGTDDTGELLHVDAQTGRRTLITDFGNPAQGPVGDLPQNVALFSNGDLYVSDRDAPSGNGGIYIVDKGTGLRTILTDLSDGGQGPTADSARDIAEGPGGILYLSTTSGGFDNGGVLFEVNRNTGFRTVISEFGQPLQGPLASVRWINVDQVTGTVYVLNNSNTNTVLSVNPNTGNRQLISDIDNPGQGPTDTNVQGLAMLEDGRLLVNGNNNDNLLRIDPNTGFRVVLSDYDDPAEGPLGGFGQGIIIATVATQMVTEIVPTLSEWGLIAMAGILGIVGFIVARRRVTA